MTFSCSLYYFEPSTKFYYITQHLTTFIVILAQVCIFSPILYPPIVFLEILQDMQIVGQFIIIVLPLHNQPSPTVWYWLFGWIRIYDSSLSVGGDFFKGVAWLFGIINQQTQELPIIIRVKSLRQRDSALQSF